MVAKSTMRWHTLKGPAKPYPVGYLEISFEPVPSRRHVNHPASGCVRSVERALECCGIVGGCVPSGAERLDAESLLGGCMVMHSSMSNAWRAQNTYHTSCSTY